MSKSLADLAPRNAMVALEGAIGDLMQRVETVRQAGHVESTLAPLQAMAAELRAAMKTHDPQAVAAGLEREIRAIGGKIDSLATTAIRPETFERIRRQTKKCATCLLPPPRAPRRSTGWNGESANSPTASSNSAQVPRPISSRPRWLLSRRGAAADRARRGPRGAGRNRAPAGGDRGAARSGNCAPQRSGRDDPRPFDDLARRIDERASIARRALAGCG